MVTGEEDKVSGEVAKVNIEVDDLDDLLRQEREREKLTNSMAPPETVNNSRVEISTRLHVLTDQNQICNMVMGL